MKRRTGDADVVEFSYLLDNVHLTSVGIDIGSSTTQLMFSEIHMRRKSLGLSSRFVVVSRTVLWRSQVVLTPYVDGNLIDTAAVRDFIDENFSLAGMAPTDVDTGAIILTGEALKRDNARALAEAMADVAGDFVCVTAGHNLEAMLAAFGSGAAELSVRDDEPVLCVDVGGGTTKFARVVDGRVLATGAIEVGGRILAWDEQRRLQRITPMAQLLLPEHSELRLGDYFDPVDEQLLAARIAEQILALPRNDIASIDPRLILTDEFEEVAGEVGAITFSGGVAEYVFGREVVGYGDLGAALGAQLRAVVDAAALPARVEDLGTGIRATVAGTSQSSVQVSGNTVTASAGSWPLRNVAVLDPSADLRGDVSAAHLADAITRAVAARGLSPDEPFALSFRWQGVPSFARLRAFAAGVHQALDGRSTPTIVMLDKDLGASVGAILREEFGHTSGLICLDNLELEPLDYVDIGGRIEPAGVFPVVIKSLLFHAEGAATTPDRQGEIPALSRQREVSP